MTEVRGRSTFTTKAVETFTRPEHGSIDRQDVVKTRKFATALAPAILAVRRGVNNVKEAFGIRTDKFDETRPDKSLKERKKAALGRLYGEEEGPTKADTFTALNDKGPITMGTKPSQGELK